MREILTNLDASKGITGSAAATPSAAGSNKSSASSLPALEQSGSQAGGMTAAFPPISNISPTGAATASDDAVANVSEPRFSTKSTDIYCHVQMAILQLGSATVCTMEGDKTRSGACAYSSAQSVADKTFPGLWAVEHFVSHQMHVHDDHDAGNDWCSCASQNDKGITEARHTRSSLDLLAEGPLPP